MTEIWRFLDTGPCTAAYSMALDEAIAIAVRHGNMPPTLRLYGWCKPSVTIGYFQKISDVDVGYCTRKDIPFVRRLTGGRAILHGDEMTYSFSSKTASGRFSKGLMDSYRKISTAFGLALSKMGIAPELKLVRASRGLPLAGLRTRSPLCFQSVSYGEIMINSRKLMGSAQKRWNDALLQQGSILLVADGTDAAKIFRFGTAQQVKDSLTGLHDVLPNFVAEDFKRTIRISFEETFNVKFAISFLSAEEISMARKLEAQKYSCPEWNFKK